MSKSKPITVKKFITLSCEAIKSLTKDKARETYKSIKNKENSIWTNFKDVEHALALKCKLNEQIEDLEDELDENPEDSDKYQLQLKKLFTKSSTKQLINDLSKGFNINIVSISDQTISDFVNSPSTKKIKKKSIKSANSEDSDDDDSDEIFSFEAYMKLKKQNSQMIIEEKNDNNEDEDIYPVDEDANYEIISKHFEQNTTHNENVDHSVLNFDDLKSIHLNEDSSESDESSDDDDYADSKLSINTKETHSNNNNTNKHKWSVDDIEENGKSVISDDKSSHLSPKNSQRKHRWSVDEEDEEEDDVKEKEDEFYDETDSAMGIASPVLSDTNSSKPTKTFTKAIKKRASKSMKSLKLKKKPSKQQIIKKKKKMKQMNLENGLNEMSLGLMSSLEEKWNNLNERVLNDYDWSERDCAMLMDEASILKKREIVIYSMWLSECQKIKMQNKNTMKFIQCAVIIGYSGQQCLASKIAEIKWCIKQKVDKVIVVLSAAKVMDRDWNYVKKEVNAIYKITAKKCKLEIRHAKSNKIDTSTKAMFEQIVEKILQ